MPIAAEGNLCQLRYVDRDNRWERLLHPVPALRYRDLRTALASDLILVNFISGRDLSVGSLERLRSEFDGIMYVDIHSYLLGRHRDGTRFARRPAGWGRVVNCADVLQMNAGEFRVLSDEAADVPGALRWVRDVLTPGRCRCLLLTLSSAGVLCVSRRHGRWFAELVPASRRPAGVDPTGSGDTFAGAWIAAWLRGADIIAATRKATARAAHPLRPML